MLKFSCRGSILIFTLWVILLLTLFALGLSYRGRVEIKSVSYDIDELKAHYLAKSAANWMIKKLKSEYKGYDTEFDLEKYIVEDYSLGNGIFTIKQIKDEESKINFNIVPYEVLKYIPDLSSNYIIETIKKNKPFYNVESLIIIDEINEDIVERLKDDWLTVYGNGEINFNTTDYSVINVLKGLPAISNLGLEKDMCNRLNNKFSCCQYSAVGEKTLLAKNTVFDTIRKLKYGYDFFKSVNNLINKIDNSDLVIQNKLQIENVLRSDLYHCCMDKYDDIDKDVYCSKWSKDESKAVTEELFTGYIINEIFKYVDVKSHNYSIDIIAEVNNVKKYVTVILNRKLEDIQYWYSHYYTEYEK